MEKLYTVLKNKTRADCGSDHELLIAKFGLELKKVWKTTRPFRYDLNQIPYHYTVEVTNRFKGLNLIDRDTYIYTHTYKEGQREEERKERKMKGREKKDVIKDANGNSLVVQRLGFRVLTAEGLGSIPTQAIKMPQATQSKKKKKKPHWLKELFSC